MNFNNSFKPVLIAVLAPLSTPLYSSVTVLFEEDFNDPTLSADWDGTGTTDLSSASGFFLNTATESLDFSSTKSVDIDFEEGVFSTSGSFVRRALRPSLTVATLGQPTDLASFSSRITLIRLGDLLW